MRRQDDLGTGAGGAAAALPAAHAPADAITITAAVADWNAAARAAIRAARMDAALAARTLAAMHTCMYNAWAAYDDAARQTVQGVGIRLPRGERDAASQAAAMHHAARVLLGARLPVQAALFEARMAACGLGPDTGAPQFSPAGIGKAQALSMLDANPATPFAALPGGIAAAPGAPDGTVLERCWTRARQVADAGRLAEGQDVLLYMVLANALADAGGAGASAAAEVLRRFGATRRDGLVQGPADALGKEIGARVFDKARRYRQGRL